MKIPIHILLIEDSENDAVLLLRQLKRSNYEVTFNRVDTSAAMLAALNTQTWDLIICDYVMPQFSAPAALELLKKTGLDLPFIIVSGTIGEDTAVSAMKAGAHDYIIKGNLTRLIPAIERELREVEVRLARKQAEEQLKASLQEKELLLQEIHHRVKNNLQIISSLLNLQVEHIQDKQAIEVFKNTQNRISSMALIHDKLYQSKDLARINFAEYIQDLTNSLFSAYEANANKIALKIDVQDIFLSIDAAIPCGLIINELILNAMKYAFPTGRQGEIFVKFHSVAYNKFVLFIGDNGVGFPKDLDLKSLNSLGLQLVSALVKQLSGDIETNTSNGAQFKITFARRGD